MNGGAWWATQSMGSQTFGHDWAHTQACHRSSVEGYGWSHHFHLNTYRYKTFTKLQFNSVTQSSPILCDSMDCSMPGFLSITSSGSLLKLKSIESVMPSNHLILCHPLLHLPSVVPSISVFSSESVLHIRLPKYWSFSFSIHPSNEYSGLISFLMDLFDILAVTKLRYDKYKSTYITWLVYRNYMKHIAIFQYPSIG